MTVVRPRLVLHIGTEKTGTTSIQSFAYSNRKLLQEKYSILYPEEIGNQFGHTKIALLGYENSRKDDLTIANYNDSDARHKTRESWAQSLHAAVRQTSCHTVFLSSEFFQSRLVSTEDLVRLRNILNPLFSQIEVVMYVRTPISTALSLMSEAIKNGSTDLVLPLRIVVILAEFVIINLLAKCGLRFFPRPSLLSSHIKKSIFAITRLLMTFFITSACQI